MSPLAVPAPAAARPRDLVTRSSGGSRGEHPPRLAPRRPATHPRAPTSSTTPPASVPCCRPCPTPDPMPADLVARISASIAAEQSAREGGTVVPLRPRAAGAGSTSGAAAAAAVVLAVGLPALLTGTGPGDVMASLSGGGSDAPAAPPAPRPRRQWLRRRLRRRSRQAPGSTPATGPATRDQRVAQLGRRRGASEPTGTAYTPLGPRHPGARTLTAPPTGVLGRQGTARRRRRRAPACAPASPRLGVPGLAARCGATSRPSTARPRSIALVEQRSTGRRCMPCRPTATPQHPAAAGRPAHPPLSRRRQLRPSASCDGRDHGRASCRRLGAGPGTSRPYDRLKSPAPYVAVHRLLDHKGL